MIAFSVCSLLNVSFTSYELYLQRHIKKDRVFLVTSISYPVCQLSSLINLLFFGKPSTKDDSIGYVIMAGIFGNLQKLSCLATLFYILAIQYV